MRIGTMGTFAFAAIMADGHTVPTPQNPVGQRIAKEGVARHEEGLALAGQPEKWRVEKADMVPGQDERPLRGKSLGVIDAAPMIQVEVEAKPDTTEPVP